MNFVLRDRSDEAWSAVTNAADWALMGLYAHVRKNADRLARLCIMLLPLMMLLVGSCKTTDAPAAYGSNANAEQFRTALFPDRVNFTGISYYPAEGYIARARKFVARSPETVTLLTEEEITYLFGAPDLKRRDAKAEVWQYKNASCVVDFYFYDEPGLESQSRVAYADVRPEGRVSEEGPSRKEQVGCLKRVSDASSVRI